MLIKQFMLDTPDDGAGGGESAKMAKFASQLSPELREQHKGMLSGDYADKHLNDVWTELVDLKGKSARSILIPNKDSPPEERKEFLEKMGIPETPDGYELAPAVIKDEKFLKDFRAEALKSGLTKTQAQKQLALVENMAKTGLKLSEDAQAKQAETLKAASETFTARLSTALNGDATQADEVINLATKYHVRMGSKALLEKIRDNGMLFDPEYMLFASEMEKLAGDDIFHDGDPNQQGKGGNTGGAFGRNYSSEFTAQHGRKK